MDAVSKSFQDVWPESQLTNVPAPTTTNGLGGGKGGTLNNSVDDALPVAVSIVITLKDLGDITRIVEVSSCGANCP
jgi:hypothetical protein